MTRENETSQKVQMQLVEERRRFHAWPEIGGEEKETAAYIAAEMAKLGMKPLWAEDTFSAFYLLDTGKPGKTLVLRADIDALPMPEDGENLAGKKACVSLRGGFCHACGHDAHTAMLLAAARILAKKKDALRGKIWFLFESGEENGASSRQVCRTLQTLQADAMWGIHVVSFMDTGTISVQAGPRMAGSGPFCIRIHGHGGHGSRPDQAKNPVVAAAEIVCKLQSVVSLQLSPYDAGVMNVASIRGGETWNIIPQSCEIQGGMRYFDDAVLEKMQAQMEKIVQGVCLANDCTAEFIQLPAQMPAVRNDPKLSALAERAVDKVLPGARVEREPWMASETFGCYQKMVPGVFAFLGMKSESVGSGALHHNGKFDVDEACMPLGVMATVQFACDFLSE